MTLLERTRSVICKALGLRWTGKAVPASASTLAALSDVGWVLGLRVLRQALAVVVTVVLVRLCHSGSSSGGISSSSRWWDAAVHLPCSGCGGRSSSRWRAVTWGTFTAGTLITLRFSLIGSALLLAVAAGSYLYGQREQAVAFIITAVLFPGAYGLNQWQSLQVGQRDFRTNSIRGSVGVIGSGVAVMAVALEGWSLIALAGRGGLCGARSTKHLAAAARLHQRRPGSDGGAGEVSNTG